MSATLEATERGFVVRCGCEDPPRELYRVEGADQGLWSYHLRHARGGLFWRCVCGSSYALAGLVGGYGAPAVVDLGDVDLERCSPLPRLALLVLDVANKRDDAVWERSAEAIRHAQLLLRLEPEERARVGRELQAFLKVDPARAEELGPVLPSDLLAEARLAREWLQRKKFDELREIARESFGLEAWPAGARIFRTLDGGGFVDWGSAEAKRKALGIESPGRVVDLEDYAPLERPLELELGRVVDLS